MRFFVVTPQFSMSLFYIRTYIAIAQEKNSEGSIFFLSGERTMLKILYIFCAYEFPTEMHRGIVSQSMGTLLLQVSQLCRPCPLKTSSNL